MVSKGTAINNDRSQSISRDPRKKRLPGSLPQPGGGPRSPPGAEGRARAEPALPAPCSAKVPALSRFWNQTRALVVALCPNTFHRPPAHVVCAARPLGSARTGRCRRQQASVIILLMSPVICVAAVQAAIPELGRMCDACWDPGLQPWGSADGQNVAQGTWVGSVLCLYVLDSSSSCYRLESTDSAGSACVPLSSRVAAVHP